MFYLHFHYLHSCVYFLMVFCLKEHFYFMHTCFSLVYLCVISQAHVDVVQLSVGKSLCEVIWHLVHEALAWN